MQHFYPFISQVSYCWCPPFSAGFSAGHVAFLFICLPHLSLLVSALFRWRCNISIRLSPRSVTGGVRPFPLAMQHVYSSPRSITAGVRPCPLAMQHFYLCVSPPFSAGISILSSPRSVTGVSLSIGHEVFLFICLPGPLLLVSPLFRWPCSILFICLPGLSLLVSALFRWRCNNSIQVCLCWCPPFSVGHVAFYSFVSQVCHCWCQPFSAGDATILFICFPGLSLLVSALFRWPCSISIHLFPGSVTGAAALFCWPCSISIHLSPM